MSIDTRAVRSIRLVVHAPRPIPSIGEYTSATRDGNAGRIASITGIFRIGDVDRRTIVPVQQQRHGNICCWSSKQSIGRACIGHGAHVDVARITNSDFTRSRTCYEDVGGSVIAVHVDAVYREPMNMIENETVTDARRCETPKNTAMYGHVFEPIRVGMGEATRRTARGGAACEVVVVHIDTGNYGLRSTISPIQIHTRVSCGTNLIVDIHMLRDVTGCRTLSGIHLNTIRATLNIAAGYLNT